MDKMDVSMFFPNFVKYEKKFTVTDPTYVLRKRENLEENTLINNQSYSKRKYPYHVYYYSRKVMSMSYTQFKDFTYEHNVIGGELVLLKMLRKKYRKSKM
jgi:hypothetical protein